MSKPKPKQTVGDYVFVLSQMNPKTGIYEPIGVTDDENEAKDFFDPQIVRRVEIFILGKQEGPTLVCHDLEEMENTGL